MDRTKIIVCPVDFSPGSTLAVEKAAELARATGSRVELLHVYQLPVLALPDGVISATPAYITTLTSNAQQQLDEIAEGLRGRGVQVATKLVEGSPAQAILEHAARLPAGLIVLGTHGRRGFQRFLMGSTAERVVRLANIPVLTVRMDMEEQLA